MLEQENITTSTEQFNFNLTSIDYDFSNSSISCCGNVTDNEYPKLNIPYTILESLVAFVAVIGNALVIIVFYRERRLRRRTNYYIISLAIADFLVGFFGIPFAILVRKTAFINFNSCDLLPPFIPLGVDWQTEKSLCMLIHNVIAGCPLHHFDILPRRCIYWPLLGNFFDGNLILNIDINHFFQAILHPLAYSRNVRTKTAIGQFNL